MIVPHSPRRAWWLAIGLLGWVFGLGMLVWLWWGAAGGGRDFRAELMATREASDALADRIEELEQEAANLRRSDQVSRDALRQMQQDLAARDEEIAGLRADVSFYERLVGGSAQRKGLSVHSVSFRPEADGVAHFSVTLTQNIKKAGTSRGQLTLSIEGVQDGGLHALDWAELRQGSGDQPLDFEFRYFQRVEGSVMLPAGFKPHRVLVRLQRDKGVLEQSIPWEDTQKP